MGSVSPILIQASCKDLYLNSEIVDRPMVLGCNHNLGILYPFLNTCSTTYLNSQLPFLIYIYIFQLLSKSFRLSYPSTSIYATMAAAVADIGESVIGGLIPGLFGGGGDDQAEQDGRQIRVLLSITLFRGLCKDFVPTC